MPDPGLFPEVDAAADLAEQIACVEREIRMRQRVYPHRIGTGKMSREDADREIDTMRRVLATLRKVQAP